ncbi:iron complex outermembrane recepter protein [Pseudoxanthomonas sp. GM95]|uniref:TonB-dependent receptor n=1 Tax=Pseudoxanthomonas sp. GM95 TaxID=1881043 RepID=UPI0008D124F9|nr:TonB-dependent receptor [Pseudoxanthomonas sp. GM95]SEL85633.1 iron complex outermembrane recepter protein [Pseudoxanthomonas sp. GM95]
MLTPKRNLLCVALASALTLATTHAAAQSAPTDPPGTPADDSTDKTDGKATDLDRVKVTGIRRGIEAAIDTKQSMDNIVEAISAEDIGKLPDASIADSIARLPGLTAQRYNGRAQQINIRGFDGGFATTNLNGREQVSLNINRGVEFDQYPSELVSQVVVSKTADAAQINQGLSGTVDLQTVRPLSFDERVTAVNYRRDMNKIEDQKKFGERYSLSYIDQFADRTVGLALGYAHLNNPGQGYEFNSWGYDGNGGLSGSDLFTYERDNTRDGFAATLQWEPNENFSSVLDVFYSKFDRDENKRGVQFGLATDTVGQTSGNGTVTQGTATASPVVLRNDYNGANDKLLSIGWNNKLKFAEAWTLSTDISTSIGHRDETVLETYAASAAPVELGYTYNPDGYFDFDFGQDFTDLDAFSLMDPGGWGGDRAQAGYLKKFKVKDQLTATRIDLERSFDESMFSKIRFGANFTDRVKSRDSQEFTLCITQECTENVPGAITSDLATVRGLGFAGLDSFVSLDPMQLVDTVYYQLEKDHPDIAKKDWEVRERVGTFYLQADINTDLGSIPVKGNVGIRAVNTDQSSSGTATYSGNAIGEETNAGLSYMEYLPSLNLTFQFPADQYVRLGLGRQMARPRMDDLRVNFDIGYDATQEIWTATGGNTKLKPWIANAADLSYEWYFGGNKGYFSAAYFYKDLRSYIVNAITDFDIRNTPYPAAQYPADAGFAGKFTQPINGEGGKIHGYELALSMPFDLLWSPLEGFGLQTSYSDTTSAIEPQNGFDRLPGLSNYVSSTTLYFERWGFSARASRRTRSHFVGEVIATGGDPALQTFDAEAVVDFQLGYVFQSGPLKDLSFLFQVNNVTDEPFKQYNTFSDRPAKFSEYGRTYLLGMNYKF